MKRTTGCIRHLHWVAEVFLFAVLLSSAGCNRAEQDWVKAKATDDYDTYANYVRKWSQSPHAAEARMLAEALAPPVDGLLDPAESAKLKEVETLAADGELLEAAAGLVQWVQEDRTRRLRARKSIRGLLAGLSGKDFEYKIGQEALFAKVGALPMQWDAEKEPIWAIESAMAIEVSFAAQRGLPGYLLDKWYAELENLSLQNRVYAMIGGLQQVMKAAEMAGSLSTLMIDLSMQQLTERKGLAPFRCQLWRFMERLGSGRGYYKKGIDTEPERIGKLRAAAMAETSVSVRKEAERVMKILDIAAKEKGDPPVQSVVAESSKENR